MGGRLASASRYGGAGLTLLTESGGNLVVADGAQLLVAPGSAPAPSIANKLNTDTGFNVAGSIAHVYIDNIAHLDVRASGLSLAYSRLSHAKGIVHAPSADQTLDAVGSTLTVNSGHLKAVQTGTVTSTATPFMAAGTDGERVLIEFIGAGSFTLQDDGTLAGTLLQLQNGSNQTFNANDIVEFVYSSDQALWVQAREKVGL